MPFEQLMPGHVWLVGAGPGDPELLTVKAVRALEAADIVFYDALVSQDIIALIPPGTEKVSVGKRKGRHSLPQDAINDCLVEAAQAGLKVVRLKGGDPGIFGRLREETDALRAAGLPFRIVPGITAAAAAAASAGTSLTLRGASRALTLVTAHARAGEVLDIDWASLADPRMTLAVYMGKSAAMLVADGLRNAGLAAHTPCLLMESASTAHERQIHAVLGDLAAAAQQLGDGPAMLLIGAAVAAPQAAINPPSTGKTLPVQ